MTEAEWLAATDPQPMFDYLLASGRVSDRKLRLFAVACCRRVWLHMGEGVAPEVVGVSDRFADGEASKKELRAVRSRLGARGGYSAAWAANNALHAILEGEAKVAAVRAISHATDFRYFLTVEEKHPARSGERDAAIAAREAERTELTALVRDLFGNTFRPVPALAPAVLDYNGGTAPKVAAAIYAERTFDRLPILADALEDAGCTDSAILGHCREDGEHVRGCWVVDLLLGKT
jgi:hypothetical protein